MDNRHLQPKSATTLAMPEGPVRRRPSFVLAVAVFALAFGAFAGDAAAVDGTVTVTYVGCTGMRVSPNPVPAGSYNVLVYDDDNCKASFSLSGPGVNLTSDLDSTGMGIDHPAGPFGPYTFQSGASYTARDSNINASATFSASASSGSSGGSSGSSTGGSSSSGTTGSTSSSSSGTKTLGTLAGSISPTGKATLTIGGATVKKLKAGVYKLTVADHSKKAGLVIQALGYHAMTESTLPFTGTKTTTLRVIAGKYFFQASGGPKTYFTVTS